MSERNHDSPNNSFNSNEKLTKNDVKFRENLYRLIVSQLFYDGYQHVAVGLSAAIQVYFYFDQKTNLKVLNSFKANPPCPPSNRLLNLLKNTLQNENFSLTDSKDDFEYKKIPNGDYELSGKKFT